MKIKPIVTVMNFHALLRVDSSRRLAERQKLLEKEISALMDKIVNNRNIVLDKKTLKVNPRAPELGIYFGSDHGFCGSINSEINARLLLNDKEEKIVIGSRLNSPQKPLAAMKREEFEKGFPDIEKLLVLAVKKRKYSRIHLYYNHYYNMSRIEPVKKCIYPFTIGADNKDRNTEDYMIEGNFEELMENLAVTYLSCEVKIAAANSFASENIIRQNVTSDSLDKIDELEMEETRAGRRQKNRIAFAKVIETYIRKRGNKHE